MTILFDIDTDLLSIEFIANLIRYRHFDHWIWRDLPERRLHYFLGTETEVKKCMKRLIKEFPKEIKK